MRLNGRAMKSLSALALSLALLLPAAPTLAQPQHGHEQHGGGGGGGGPHGAYGGGPRGGYAEPRGGYPGPRGGYPEQRGYPAPRGAYPEQRGPYGAPQGGYGYYGAPSPGRRGPDSLGADWGGQQDEVRAGVRQGRYMGLARVIGSIRQRTPGHQLDAGLEQWGGRAVYRVRWAEPGGRRIDYIVDAQSGAILQVDGR